MSNGGKGSSRRPGAIPQGAWEAIFAPKVPCDTCLGTGLLVYVEDNGDLADEYKCLECMGTGEVPCSTN